MANWDEMLQNNTPPSWEDVNPETPTFQNVELAGPSSKIKDLGKAFDFQGGGKDYISEESLTGTRLSNLLNKDNPYIQNARNRAKVQANKLGLLSSTLAMNAGETAAINSALPIAQQEASILSQADLNRQNANIQSKLFEQQYLQGLGGTQQKAQYNAAGQMFNAANQRQQQEFNALHNAYMQTQQLAAQGLMNKEDADAAMARLQAEIQSKFGLQEEELANRLTMQQLENQARFGLQEEDLANRIILQGMVNEGQANTLDKQLEMQYLINKENNMMKEILLNTEYNFKERLAKMGYDSQIANQILAEVGNLTNTYLANYAAILTNPNLTPEASLQAREELNGEYVTKLNDYLFSGTNNNTVLNI